MRLYLIRHGQSVNNALYEDGKEHERVHDPDLTEKGYEQAELVAQFIVETLDMPGKAAEPFGLTHLYCSAMYRALLTAHPISKALGLPAEVWPDIHELGGLFLVDDDGNETGYPGMTRSEIQAKFPGYVMPDSITEEGWYNKAQGVEAPPEFMARAIRVAIALHERADSNERIALVSHGGFMDLLIKALLNQLPTRPEILFYTHYNTGITRLDFGEGYHGLPVPDRLRLHYMNRTAHLPQTLKTY